jgi:hypothetical protein
MGRAEAMTLGDKQKLLGKLVPRLIDMAHELGYEVTLGDAYRDSRVFGGMGETGPVDKNGKRISYGAPNSCHKLRLAIDLNLFKDGNYLTKTEDHEVLGRFWINLHPLCRWGGYFKTPDGNHYAIEHEGRS